MLKVHEIFKSIQGEGIDIGMPMVFVRFAGCNLACKWCDTQYANKEESEFSEMEVSPIVKKIEELGTVTGVTFTGGEPFVQKTEEIDALIFELKGKGYFINIETNGLVLPQLAYGNLVDRFSISPKLSSSGNKLGINKSTLETYLMYYPHKVFFKFVISNKDDFSEMEVLLDSIPVVKEKSIRIVIQPNIDDESVLSIEKQNEYFLETMDLLLVSGLTDTYNIRIIPQFHKYLWADKKGV